MNIIVKAESRDIFIDPVSICYSYAGSIFVKMATGDTYVVADKHTKKIVEKAMDLIFERLKKAATTTPGIHKNMVIIDISKIIAEAKEV